MDTIHLVAAAFRTEWDTDPNPSYDIWTITNGSEIVPGVLTPFTATTFNELDVKGLKKLMATYPGGSRVKLFKAPVGNFFGVTAGRLAINTGFSVAAVSVLEPQIAEAMLAQFFTGLQGSERFVVKLPPATREAAYAAATAQRDAAPATLAAYRERLYAERASGRYEEDLQLDAKAAWSRWAELMDENMCELLLTHYVVSVAAGEFQVRLAGLIAAGGGDPNAIVGLCSGLGEVESSKPAIALYDLAKVAAKHPAVAAALRDDAPAAVAERLAEPPDKGWAAFAKAFKAFLFDYGYRVQGEADLANADWNERPAFALSQVRAMLALPEADAPKAQVKRAAADRKALEKAVRKALPSELRPAFDDAAAKAQHFTRLRETSKAMWMLGTRRARAPYLALGRSLAASGKLRRPEDLAFLTSAEVKALANGRKVDPAELTASIARRKRQHRAAAAYVLPDWWIGTVRPVKQAAVVQVDALNGLGVSVGAGPVTGVARIIPSAEAGLGRDIEPGEILVAPFTDAPWTPLFICAGAVVVETGGVLSHAATVAREFGIPCVVMCKDATRIINDGDTVTVNGATGTVSIDKRA